MTDTRHVILDALADGPATGPELADRLNITRTAVWYHIDALRATGFTITATPEGYSVEEAPDYGGAAIAYGLDAPFTVEFHDTIGSTNDRARELATTGTSDVVVIAEAQTSGRGRLSRDWTSPPGGIWLSLALHPAFPPAHAPLLTLAAAVATARAIEETGVSVGVKWPNDVLTTAEELKVAGILTELGTDAGRITWLVIGIGINANISTDALPAGATSLLAERGEINRRTVVHRLLNEFDALRRHPDAILPAWREHTLTLGRSVRVDTPDGPVTGTAVDIAHPGSLLIDTDDDRVRVHTGDCEHLRPV